MCLPLAFNASSSLTISEMFQQKMLTLLAGYGVLYIVSEDIVFEAEQAHNSLFLQRGIFFAL